MPGQQITWNVVSQSPTQKFDSNGNPIDGKTVTFKTSTGYEGSLFVPDPVYAQPDQVKEMILGEVKRVAAIHALSGSVTV